MELDHTMSDMLAELVISNRCSTSRGIASVEARKPSPFGVVESVRRTYVVEALTLWRSSESEVRRVGECDTLKDAIETAQQVIDESLITWNYDGPRSKSYLLDTSGLGKFRLSLLIPRIR